MADVFRGCCSRFIMCSDVKACILKDSTDPQLAELSNTCSYRPNLERGRIFFGVNANSGSCDAPKGTDVDIKACTIDEDKQLSFFDL